MQAPCKHHATSEPILLIPDSLIPDSLEKSKSKDLSAPTAQTKKGTRLPDDWQLPKTWGEFAMAEKPSWTADDVRRVADDFKDHWLANANQSNSKKADWFATWRKWVRSPLNELKYSRGSLVDRDKALAEDNARVKEAARKRIFGDMQNETV